MSILGPIVFASVMFILGAFCVWRPENVQRIAIRASSRGITGRSSSLERFVRSRQYLRNVRVVGVIALLISVFIGSMIIQR